MVGGNDSSVPRTGGQQATAHSLLFVFFSFNILPAHYYPRSIVLNDPLGCQKKNIKTSIYNYCYQKE